MKVTVPDYYNKFRCIAEKCPDNCCIGWEIDVDDYTYEKYLCFTDKLGNKLRENLIVSEDGSHCFKLDSSERCPFLNNNNLCEIILEAGEDNLCSICSEHPRFHNCFGNIRESGIGICCIAAAELVLSAPDKAIFRTYSSEEKEYEIDFDADSLTEIISIRNEMIEILQDRSKSVCARMTEMLMLAYDFQNQIDGTNAEIIIPEKPDTYRICDIIRSLEPLNSEWTMAAEKMKPRRSSMRNSAVFEQLAVYFIYRHTLSAVYDGDILSRAKFAVLCCIAVLWIADNSELETIIKTACLVSKEIEYSDENINTLLDLSATEPALDINKLLGLLNEDWID